MEFGGGIIDLQCCKYYHLPNDFPIQTSIIHDNVSWQVADENRFDSRQWMNSSINHDSICKLIHKKWHRKSYHITLNIISNVANTYELYPTRSHLHLKKFVLFPTKIWRANSLHWNLTLIMCLTMFVFIRFSSWSLELSFNNLSRNVNSRNSSNLKVIRTGI